VSARQTAYQHLGSSREEDDQMNRFEHMDLARIEARLATAVEATDDGDDEEEVPGPGPANRKRKPGADAGEGRQT
jgi:hypothetical protein